jgi:hypothetical protein
MPHHDLPLVLAGPILRRLTPTRLTFWLATSQPVLSQLTLVPEQGEPQFFSSDELCTATRELDSGQKLFFYLIDLPVNQALPQDCWIGYQLELQRCEDAQNELVSEPSWLTWREWAPELCYPGRDMPGFVLKSKLDQLLHGSCRKPHHVSGDGLVRADQHLAEQLDQPENWPGLLMMGGDQIYSDDVAGPMLVAIHRLLEQLQLPVEALPEARVSDTAELYQDQSQYYHREDLLPVTQPGRDVRRRLFEGVRKPVFTTDTAHNHLVSLGEVLAMYLLVWSPAGWQGLSLDMPVELAPEMADRYQKERREVEAFARPLAGVQRVMAHLPVAMMFDDHDITDDWNLTAGWEQTAYGHPFSRRIIGNTLLGYLICQGWGNAPEQYPDTLMQQVQHTLKEPGLKKHDQLITDLYRFSHWHYQWDTQPVLMVLDTRTHRWRSEKGLNQPSGLMDWEALTDLQHRLIGHDAVVLVSPAPIFGVKLIEAVQKLFTLCGKPLMVDAENWMAHPGAAYTMMNMFRHAQTPRHFVILSGDVHYSFAYDIELKGDKRGQDIWQITSSGMKNEFPKKLLTVFDRLNRWLYSPKSPLNWFTKRRKMRIIPRKPDSADPGERLLNAAGIGLVELTVDGRPKKIVQLCADRPDIEFHPREHEAHWE